MTGSQPPETGDPGFEERLDEPPVAAGSTQGNGAHLGYLFAPVPRPAVQALASRRLAPEDFAIVAFLYGRADLGILRRRGETPTLTLREIAEGVGIGPSPRRLAALGRRLRRLRDDPEAWFTYTREGRDRYVFTLRPDDNELSEVATPLDGASALASGEPDEGELSEVAGYGRRLNGRRNANELSEVVSEVPGPGLSEVAAPADPASALASSHPADTDMSEVADDDVSDMLSEIGPDVSEVATARDPASTLASNGLAETELSDVLRDSRELPTLSPTNTEVPTPQVDVAPARDPHTHLLDDSANATDRLIEAIQRDRLGPPALSASVAGSLSDAARATEVGGR